jgi:hypothetical protein
VLHRLETTGGHAEIAGGCGEQRLSAYHAQQHAASKPPAAARERSRALTATSPLNGQGVALLGNNRRPCLKQPEAADRVLHCLETTGGPV